MNNFKTYTEGTSKMITNILTTSYMGEMTTHDLAIIWTSLALVTALALWQILLLMIEWRKNQTVKLLTIIKYVLTDVLVLILIVFISVVVDYKILKIGEPRNIEAERIGNSLVRVKWETFDPQVGVMLWGYEKNNVGQVELGNSGEQATKYHDVLLEVEPGTDIYYYLIMDDQKFGLTNGDPYVLKVNDKDYQLIKVDVTDE